MDYDLPEGTDDKVAYLLERSAKLESGLRELGVPFVLESSVYYGTATVRVFDGRHSLDFTRQVGEAGAADVQISRRSLTALGAEIGAADAFSACERLGHLAAKGPGGLAPLSISGMERRPLSEIAGTYPMLDANALATLAVTPSRLLPCPDTAGIEAVGIILASCWKGTTADEIIDFMSYFTDVPASDEDIDAFIADHPALIAWAHGAHCAMTGTGDCDSWPASLTAEVNNARSAMGLSYC